MAPTQKTCFVIFLACLIHISVLIHNLLTHKNTCTIQNHIQVMHIRTYSDITAYIVVKTNVTTCMSSHGKRKINKNMQYIRCSPATDQNNLLQYNCINIYEHNLQIYKPSLVNAFSRTCEIFTVSHFGPLLTLNDSIESLNPSY